MAETITYKSGHILGNRLVWFAASAVASALALSACGGPSSAAKVQPSASPTPNAYVAGSEVLAAVDTMVTSSNANLAAFNSSNPATATAGITAIVADHQAFDSTLQGITFPSADTAAVSSVLSADSAYEAALGVLAVNTNSVSTYNGVFDTVVPLRSAFQAALATLGRDFGITLGGTATPSP